MTRQWWLGLICGAGVVACIWSLCFVLSGEGGALSVGSATFNASTAVYAAHTAKSLGGGPR